MDEENTSLRNQAAYDREDHRCPDRVGHGQVPRQAHKRQLRGKKPGEDQEHPRAPHRVALDLFARRDEHAAAEDAQVVVAASVEEDEKHPEVGPAEEKLLDVQRDEPAASHRYAIAHQHPRGDGIDVGRDPQRERNIRGQEKREPDRGEVNRRIHQPPVPAALERRDQRREGPEVEVNRHTHQVARPPLTRVVVQVDDQHHPESDPERLLPEDPAASLALGGQEGVRERDDRIGQLLVVRPLPVDHHRKADEGDGN